ncbi:signal transducer and activator of transcription 5B-like [Babylonia areolata]|uniref:signal transducer and activator of transcription 5B-like n=1 Tax=Babylonia areolata TaxID=304850 RepID=UPI003FD6B54B
MGRWSELMAHQETFKKLQEYYKDVFPVEVRYFICQWIEEKNWLELDPDDPNNDVVAGQLLKEMCSLLISKAQELSGDDFTIIRMRLEQTYHDFETMYGQNYRKFLKVMRDCMEKELALIREAQSLTPNAVQGAEAESAEEQSEMENSNKVIMIHLKELNDKTQEGEKKYKDVLHKQESFIIQHQENLKISNHLVQLHKQMETIQTQMRQATGAVLNKLTSQLQERKLREKNLMAEKKNAEMQLSELCKQLLKQRIEMQEMYAGIVEELQNMQRRVLDMELINWKRRQQLGGNGEPPPKSELDMLQIWCEHLAEIIWNIRQQIRRMSILCVQLPISMPDGVVDQLPGLNDVITGMLSSLVTSTFIVEQQPPQVLKKESRFSATIRLLVGGKLNIQMNAPQVKATIISETLAKNMLRSDMKAKMQTSGIILNNSGTMDFHTGNPPSSGSLSVTFRNMQLKKIQRSDKKGSEAVTEEKFCILFQSDFNVGGNDLVFQVWTLSLPVVVTVHGNQECNAMATVLWDNAFSEPGRLPFVVPEQVPWPYLGEQLSMKFRQHTGRGLSIDSLDYLASKIFGVQADYSQTLISWVQFNKDVMKDRNFTFWEWFYAVLKLTKEHLKGPWNDGSIIGFISKTQAQECLNQRENGTFLLRFSDSECGGITIAWIAESQTNASEREVWNLAPYITRDFTIRGLADRIHDLKNLVTLYPNIPKDTAFCKYYTTPQDPEQPKLNGYVPTTLVTVMVPHSGPMCDMDPHTPHSFAAPSPATSSVPPSTPGFLTDQEFPDDLMDVTDYLTTDYDTQDMPPIDPNSFLSNLTGFNVMS